MEFTMRVVDIEKQNSLGNIDQFDFLKVGDILNWIY